MLRPDYILHTLPLEELIDDCLYILELDAKQLARQIPIYERTVASGKKSEEEMSKWRSRLEHLQNRNEFFSALISRFQAFETLCLIAALNQSKQEAEFRGNTSNYGFSILFTKGATPNVLIH